MRSQNLVQYVFADGSETITTQRGKVIVVRDQPNTDYLPLQMSFIPYVQGSAPSPISSKTSRTPRKNEHLLTARLLGFGQRISNTPIRKINRDFQLPS